MRIHHLNTATMCPMGAKLVNGRGSLFERARLICHVLLIETNDGLVLVDTGLGMGDIEDPMRLGKKWVRQVAPRLDPAETALAQVKALGFSPDDVRHIIPTHLDLDHAGGLPDFPKARIHLHIREHEAAVRRTIRTKPGRYIPGHWSHEPNWKLYGNGGENWFGFSGVRPFSNRETDILIIPLPGHTPGHSGVAVRGPDKWLLHAGDAFFFHGQIENPPVPTPLGLRIFQRKADTDRAARKANQERLRVLNEKHGHEVTIFNAHDPVSFDRCAGHAHLHASG
jgi:glyoxylase-like metal-dependent hydrolase (beta-lactamase superfamily II)